MQAFQSVVTIKKVDYPVMDQAQFVYVVACLCLSAACCLIAGVVGVIRSSKLAQYNASLEKKAA